MHTHTINVKKKKTNEVAGDLFCWPEYSMCPEGRDADGRDGNRASKVAAVLQGPSHSFGLGSLARGQQSTLLGAFPITLSYPVSSLTSKKAEFYCSGHHDSGWV